jgi:spermidine synthase
LHHGRHRRDLRDHAGERSLSDGRVSDRGSLVATVLAGFAVMNGEIAAGRLLAPWFGASTTTWAMLIGSVLASLALGHLVGGRLSRRGAIATTLLLLLLGAAALQALLPRVAPPLLGHSLARFHRGEMGGLLASAALAAALIGLPMLLLGAASPLFLHAAGQRRAHAALAGELGDVAGRFYAAGTLGSLSGTFAAGLVLLPWLGTRHTFDVGAVALVLAALAVGAPWRRRTAALVAGVLLLLAVPGLAPAAPVGKLLWTDESRYNHLDVVELSGQRQLRVNEGYAVQSFTYSDGRLPLRDVWSYYALAPAWTRLPAGHRVLLLGLGGGTSAELYRRLYPTVPVTGVELDPAIVDAGRERLGVDVGHARVVIDDARRFLAGDPGHYDVIIVDAFQFPYVPFHLATREFFTLVRAHLATGGALVVNVGRKDQHREVVHAISATLASVFPHVRAADPPVASSTILVATDHPAEEDVGLAGLSLSPSSRAALERAARSLPWPTDATWPPGTVAFSDDLAPVEWLTDRILWESML